MNGCPSRVELRLYVTLDDSLGPERAGWIEEHVETCRNCQDTLDGLSADDVPSGTTLPDLSPHGYRVYKLLGAGAFGEVWLAQDLNLPRVVAVKTLRGRADRDRREGLLDALRRDAELLIAVEHPNIVRVYSWLSVGDQHYLVMKYVAGGSLSDLVNREGPLDWQRATCYAADVGEGLVKVHDKGIVHRDVKPANILWDQERDEAVLTDFGIGSRLTEPAAVGGSLPYMAPEAFDGVVSPTLDVYGLAATLFHLVTGQPPFPGARATELLEQAQRGLPDPDPRCRALPEPLERLIRAGLTADPGRRPRLREFVSTLRGELNQLLADTLTQSTVGTPGGVPVNLRLQVSRDAGAGCFELVATTHSRPDRLTRDMKRVPRAPAQVRLHTGDRVRVEAAADRPGYLTVFNIGPAGHLNLLYPEDPSSLVSAPIEAHQTLQILDVAMTPPTGRERLCATWSREPFPLALDQLQSIPSGREVVGSRPYQSTRDMKRVQHSVQGLSADQRQTVVLELDQDP